MGIVTVTLLGPFHVTVDGHQVAAFHSDKVRALLAFLAAAPGRPHRRETLAGLLWPDYPESSARRSLSQALYSLRRALGTTDSGGAPWLSASRDAVEFRAPSGWRIDVVHLADLLDACRAHVHADPYTCPSCGARLAQAAALYGGEFLTGFSLPDSAAFDEWQTVARDRYRRMAVETLRSLAARGERGGDTGQTLAYARRWALLEPLDERAHRQIMRLLAIDGQPAAALAQYEACCHTIGDELGAGPDVRTQMLYEQIRDSLFPPESVHAPADSPVSPGFLAGDEHYRPSLFVAREQELDRLASNLQRSLAGEAGFVFVSGEAGSGKTALLQAFGRRAQAEHSDLVVATGRCNAHTGIGDPYLAWREILAQLAGDVQGGWEGGSMRRDEAARLWALMPLTCRALVEVGRDLPGTLLDGEALLARAEWAARPEATWVDALRGLIAQRRSATTPDLRQVALFQQLTAVLQRLAGHHPLLLVLEDLHWADAGTVSLLFHLGTHLTGARILIAGSFRSAELAAVSESEASLQRHPLEPVLHELQRRHGEIILDLDRSDGRDFVSALLDAESNALDDSFREALYRQTGGNALFTTELLQAMRERGALRRDGSGRWRLEEAVRWGDLPPRVEGVIAERVGRLPAGLQEALRVASVEGETFTAEVVARVLGTEPRALVRELSGGVAQRQRLVASVGLGVVAGQPLSRYRFRHILVQSYLYGSLDRAERAYLHRDVAEALEATYGEHVEERALELARHYEEAGVADRAAAYLKQAGYRAAMLSGYHEAEELYTRSLSLLEAVPESRQTRELELALRTELSRVLQGTVGVTDPRVGREYQRVRQLSEELGQTPQLIEALMLLNGYHVYRGEYATAIAVAEEAAEIARRSGDPVLVALTRSLLGWAAYWSGNYVQALADLDPLTQLFETRDPRAEANSVLQGWIGFALVWKALTLAKLGYLDRGRVLARTVLEFAHDVSPAYLLANAIGACGAGFDLLLRKGESALEWANQLLRIADDKGYSQQHLYGRQLQGRALCVLGRHHEGIAVILETMKAAEAIDYDAWVAFYWCCLGESYTAVGQLSEAHDALERGMALSIDMGEGITIPSLHMARGALLAALDPPDLPGAEAAFLEAIAVARRQEARLYELRAAVALGRLWLSQGRSEEARALVQPVYDWFTEGFDLPDLVEARALLAELCTALAR